ncbi:ISL3 family transposase [Corynebacterium diphtheriae]|nr:ISL3 family transposase [Corynebacterium diphtheriae]
MLTDRQRERLNLLFADDKHVEVHATWNVYQRVRQAYHCDNRDLGKYAMVNLVETITNNVPTPLVEVARLGRFLKRRLGDILAYFDCPHTSNGPTEAINGRLEHLRGSALGFRNLTNYIARCLLEAGASNASCTLNYEEPF